MIPLRRRAVLSAILAASLPPGTARAQQFAGTYDPRAEAVAEGVWLVRGHDEPIAFANGGAIANSVILRGEAGAILIDPGPSLAYARALQALTRDLTGGPVARVYITHLHPDHSFGAAAFDPAIVHALPATRADLDRDGPGFSDAMYRMLADWMKGTNLPKMQGNVAEGRETFGGRSLRLYSLGGHSSGDLAILDEATGTLIAGDLVFHDRAPATPHANMPGWLNALDRLERVDHAVLIPGHGPLDRNGVAIAQTRDWLFWLQESLREAVMTGMGMSEAGAMPIPARFADMKVARYELQRGVSHFYPRLEAQLLPRIDRP